MIKLEAFVFNPFQENTFLLSDESGKCIIIDPGMYDPGENRQITEFIQDRGLIPEAIVNTHCHVDHVLGCRYLKDQYDIPFCFHKDDQEMLERAPELGAIFGLEVDMLPEADRYLVAGEKFQFGNSELQLIHVPGHSKGSLALYSEPDKFVITGDALFNGSIGRTDLPGGDYNTLIESIRNRLMTLPGEVKVYPGHGPSTTIAYEHDTNPFLN
jgi:hydroxyacylglutathione hydrolase